jgi:transposase
MGGERGYDAGKKVKGRKRHVVVDSLGLLLAVAITSAKLDDGAAAPQVLGKLSAALCPRLEVAYADGRYNNGSLQRWLRQERASYRVETVQRPAGAKGFVLLPKRWVVERSLAWLGRYRQLSKEYDYEPKVSESWVQVSAPHLMLRRYRPAKEHQQPAFKYPKPREKAAQTRDFFPHSFSIASITTPPTLSFTATTPRLDPAPIPLRMASVLIPTIRPHTSPSPTVFPIPSRFTSASAWSSMNWAL